MNEKATSPFWKPALMYGAIIGVIGIFLGLVFYFLNLKTKGWTNWASMAVTIAVLAYCLVSYRNEYLGGFASFGKLFVMGLMAGIVASLIGAVWNYILFSVIDPDLSGKLLLAVEEKIMNNPRIPESVLDETLEKLPKRFEIGRMTMNAMIWGTVFMAIFSLIIAAFVKKEETAANQAV